MKEKSGSWAACDFAWEIWILFWAIPCIEETPAVPGMSNTTGGRSARGMRQVVATSGRAALISKWTSGRAARGRVCAGPDLVLPAIRASL